MLVRPFSTATLAPLEAPVISEAAPQSFGGPQVLEAPTSSPATVEAVAAPTPPPMVTTAGRRTSRRRRRGILVGASVVVVIAAVGGVFGLEQYHKGGSSTLGQKGPGRVATKSSSGSSAPVLYGPGPNANPQTVAGVLNIDRSELPARWRTGRAPWSRTPTLEANSALAGCLGMPYADVGIVTAMTSPSGPSVVQSAWVTAPGRISNGFESAVVLTPSLSVAQSDLLALQGSKASACLQGWFASLDVSGDQIVGVPSVTRFSPSVGTGETAVGFHASIVTGPTASPRHISEDLVVLSDGRAEVVLFGQAVGSHVNSQIEASLIGGISNRLSAEAAT